jgi:hypothetical protein
MWTFATLTRRAGQLTPAWKGNLVPRAADPMTARGEPGAPPVGPRPARSPRVCYKCGRRPARPAGRLPGTRHGGPAAPLAGIVLVKTTLYVGPVSTSSSGSRAPTPEWCGTRSSRLPPGAAGVLDLPLGVPVSLRISRTSSATTGSSGPSWAATDICDQTEGVLCVILTGLVSLACGGEGHLVLWPDSPPAWPRETAPGEQSAGQLAIVTPGGPGRVRGCSQAR